MCSQVLTPMRKGPAGVQNLNARLQALMNPPEKGRGEIRVSSAADSPPDPEGGRQGHPGAAWLSCALPVQWLSS